MSTLQKEITFFGTVYPKVQKNVQKALDYETRVLRDLVASKSPVSSKSSSGKFKRSWRVNKTVGVGDTLIANSAIKNPLEYAVALEYGIDPTSGHTWAKSYKNSRNSGGLVKFKQRIWSAKAPGGTLKTTFTLGYTKKLSQIIADSLVEGLK